MAALWKRVMDNTPIRGSQWVLDDTQHSAPEPADAVSSHTEAPGG